MKKQRVGGASGLKKAGFDDIEQKVENVLEEKKAGGFDANV